MIAHIIDPSTTLLVGTMSLHDPQASLGTVEFISVTVADGVLGVLDRPNQYKFHLSVSDVQIDTEQIRFRADSLQFEGFFDEDRFAGTVYEIDGSMQGNFELYAQYALTPGDYAFFAGHYSLAPDHEFSLGWHELSNGPAYYYVDAEEVVRLYPIGLSGFLSERLDTLAFDPASISIQAYDGTTADADRLDWCREEDIVIPIEDYQLAGTLLLPPTEGPHPLVILCHLADTHRRDYYRLYADHFVQNGIAAFIYDKRGSGESTGTTLFSEVFELTDDATAVYHFLQKYASIKPDQIGLWGISNGAWVAPLTAERVGDAAFVIAASCSGVPPARQEQLRRANVARDLGASPRAVDLISRFWHSYFQFSTGGEWTDELESLLNQVYTDEELQNLPKHPDHAPGLQPVPPYRPIEQIRAKSGGAWKEGAFDVTHTFAKLQCPILCIWGEHDEVLPVDESLQRIQSALTASGHTSHELGTIPNATHLLYLDPPEAPPVSGILAEVMHKHMHNVEFAPGVRLQMAQWITSQLA